MKMADTLPDVEVGDTWIDVYSLTGILVGDTIYLVNKGNAPVRLYEQVAQPSDDDKNGVPLLPTTQTGSGAIVTGSTGLWVKTNTKFKQYLSVQVVS